MPMLLSTNNATAEKHTTTTNQSGDYQVLSLPAGQYAGNIDEGGFRRYSQSVELQVAQGTRVDVAMTMGEVTEQVEVTTDVPVMQTGNGSLGQVVQEKAVSAMPLNGRNVLALVGLIPGVVMQYGSGANLTGQNVFSAGSFQISGSSADQSATLVEGSPVNMSCGNVTVLVPSQDLVQEFRAQTSSNTAEYGMYTGGVVNIATKSGTNALHGTLFELLRNDRLNTTPCFSKHNPTNIIAKPAYHQNQFGADVGFPIIKDRLWGLLCVGATGIFPL